MPEVFTFERFVSSYFELSSVIESRNQEEEARMRQAQAQRAREAMGVAAVRKPSPFPRCWCLVAFLFPDFSDVSNASCLSPALTRLHGC